MLRLLVLALVILVVASLVARGVRRLAAAFRARLDLGLGRRTGTGVGTGTGAGGRPPRSLDQLVACASCGVRFPARRGLAVPGRPGELYCSEACRGRAGAAAAS